jgi:hypothetical protein
MKGSRRFSNIYIPPCNLSKIGGSLGIKKPASAFAKTGYNFFHALAIFIKRLQADIKSAL